MTTVLTGTVLTPEPAEAIAIEAGKIAAVGSARALLARFDDATQVDLDGRVAVPGFIDPHHHLSIACVHRSAVDLRHSRAIEELLAEIRRAAERTPVGKWIYAFGHDEQVLAERRHPTAAELEAAAPEHPVFAYHYSCHEGVVNERALALLGLDAKSPDPPGGLLDRDARGRLTGRLVAAALGPAEAKARASRIAEKLDDILDHFVEYERELFAVGITRIADATVSSDLALLYRKARAERGFRLPVVMMPSSDRGILEPAWDRVGNVTTGEGDDALSTGALKLILDGANRCALCLGPGQAAGMALRTLASALLRRSLDPLRPSADVDARYSRGAIRTGLMYYDDESAKRIVAEATGQGLAVALHAIGNAAVSQALTALRNDRGKLRPRIEHASILDADHVRRIADQGVTVVTQPGFLLLPTSDHLHLPPSLRFMPLRRLLDAGVLVAGSSDAPVTHFDPLVGMSSAVTRKTLSGRRLHPEQAISPSEALALYTKSAARALGLEDRVGSLEVGKRADIAVLSADPRVTRDLRVEQTWLFGEPVFERD